jgi:phosphomannomutase
VTAVPVPVVVRREVAFPASVKVPAMERISARLGREAQRVETSDGVKAFYAEGSLLLRASTSAPVCEVVAEGTTPEAAERLAAKGTRLVHDFVEALADAGSNDLWCDPV